MTVYDRVTDALPGFRRTGDRRGMARCPAHKDRTRSLSVREFDGGAVGLHCFAGCSVDQVVSAAGLQLADLFPEQPDTPGGGRRPDPRPYSAAQLLRAFTGELQVVWVLLADMAAGREIDASIRKRAGVARDRCVALLEELRAAR
ncbi:MAG: hypothetical protein O9343_14960 [Burkholderiaceae bacterium]|nr:hypothetical protein [Burkholderiaceae bacterium]MCZ8176486.1 hypothetical protein [Burkholderiaceae bacterium]